MAPTVAQKMLMEVAEGSTFSKSEEIRTTSEPAVTRRAAMMKRTRTSRMTAASLDSNDAYWMRTAGRGPRSRGAASLRRVICASHFSRDGVRGQDGPDCGGLPDPLEFVSVWCGGG